MIFRGQSGRVLSTAGYAMSTLPEGALDSFCPSNCIRDYPFLNYFSG